MTAQRIDMDRLTELVRLHRMGRSSREIERLLKIGRHTIMKYRKALEEAGLLDGASNDLHDLITLKECIER